MLVALVLVILAARDAYCAMEHSYSYMFVNLFISLIVGCMLLVMISMPAFIMILPFWNPRYFIPILSLVLSLTIQSAALAVDKCLSELKQNKERVDIFLVRGGGKWEATEGILVEALGVGTTPFLQQISVISLVVLPGFMSGQIMSGSPPNVASHYQILILALVIISQIVAILISVILAI